MSPEQDDITTLTRAIREQAEAEASQTLATARHQANSIQDQAQAQADAQREKTLQRAQDEAKSLYEHTVATAQLEAQRLKLQYREQLIERVFARARQQLRSAPQWPDYEQIARRLIREAVERLDVDEAIVRADEATRRIMHEEALSELGEELGVRLRAGTPLAQTTGVVIETPDGHRLYDNTLETRLARMRDVLRAPVYHILSGERP